MKQKAIIIYWKRHVFSAEQKPATLEIRQAQSSIEQFKASSLFKSYKSLNSIFFYSILYKNCSNEQIYLDKLSVLLIFFNLIGLFRFIGTLED